MTIYHLKEIISSKYNRKDTTRYERSVLFVVENTNTGDYALFSIDRISKHTASLRCNNGSRRELPGLVVIDWLYRIRLLENVRSSGIPNMEIRKIVLVISDYVSKKGSFSKSASRQNPNSPIRYCSILETSRIKCNKYLMQYNLPVSFYQNFLCIWVALKRAELWK